MRPRKIRNLTTRRENCTDLRIPYTLESVQFSRLVVRFLIFLGLIYVSSYALINKIDVDKSNCAKK